MALVLPNPQYDQFHSEWLKSHPLTLPNWSAPYIRPALNTDVSNGMTFGDWKKQLSDYINAQSEAWRASSGGTPPIQPPGTTSPVAPPVTASSAPPQPIPGLPQLGQQAGMNQIPMPGQLGAMARKSVLAQGGNNFNNFLSDNWSTMF